MAMIPIQSSSWASGSIRAPRVQKRHISCFFDVADLIHKEFVLPGKTMNQEFYLEALMRLRKADDRSARCCLRDDGSFILSAPFSPQIETLCLSLPVGWFINHRTCVHSSGKAESYSALGARSAYMGMFYVRGFLVFWCQIRFSTK